MKEKKLCPTETSERIISLDALRGIAILGILLMNIQSYSMIEAAYINPDAYGDLTGLNKAVWIFSHIFADQKFLSLFSILFGAGIILVSRRAETKDRGAAGIHYRRLLGLLVIGLIHAYLIWHGDILVSYAICGAIVFPFRKLSPKKLATLAFYAICIPSLVYLFAGISMEHWPEEAVQGTLNSWKPGMEIINGELNALRGGLAEQMKLRVPASIRFETLIFLFFIGWRAGGLMLLGMALYKWGVLSGEKSQKFYRKMAFMGGGIGLSLIVYGVLSNFQVRWSLEYSMFLGWQFNYWGSCFLCLGYIGIIVAALQIYGKTPFFKRIAAVGRMALTNYLTQSIICTLIFYGHGLGLVGKVERKYQFLIVLLVWTLQIIISPLWLKYFKFGPFEWLWRSMTYLKPQPLKRN